LAGLLQDHGTQSPANLSGARAGGGSGGGDKSASIAGVEGEH